MSGWNGSGVFTVPYTFVQDAANGIKILASRQDTQWATVVAGLMNCQTRDGQNMPSANWNFNGFTLNNLGAPVNPADAARLQDITVFTPNEWIADTNPFTFVSASSFKFTGVNLTARYDVKRRVKIVHNGGATTSYYTVVASSFAADTTISVNNATLVSPITAVSYAMLDAANPSSPVFSQVGLYSSDGNLLSGTDYVIGAGNPFPTTTVTGDIYSEMSSGVFTAKTAGLYTVDAVACLGDSGGTAVLLGGKIQVLQNGSALRSGPPGAFTRFNGFSVPSAFATASIADIVLAAAGDTIQVKTSGITFSNNIFNQGCSVVISQVR